jgi:arsenite methyltransferase
MGRPNGSYGVDAPYVPIAFFAAAAAAIGLGFVTGSAVAWWVIAVFFLALGGIYLRTSLSGKFIIWRDLVVAAQLAGDERAVDVGCGRGAVTVLLAEHLPRGHVDGVDLWRSQDQSGNDEAHTRANLEANRVSDRVDLHTADMRDLPFSQSSVDLVTASFSIHNLKAPADRKDAVAAAYRILKPGGRILIADISKVKEYGATLTELGAQDVRLHGAGFNGWWSAPWMATTTLVATKA